MYLALHEWRALLLGGAPPSPSWSGVTPPPSLALHAWGAHAARWYPPLPFWSGGPPPLPFLHAVHWERTLLRGYPLFALLIQTSLPCLSCMPCAIYVRCCSGSPPPHLSPGSALGLRAPCSGCPPLSSSRAQVVHSTRWGVPPTPTSPGRTLGACAAVSGGPPPDTGCAR